MHKDVLTRHVRKQIMGVFHMQYITGMKVYWPQYNISGIVSDTLTDIYELPDIFIVLCILSSLYMCLNKYFF